MNCKSPDSLHVYNHGVVIGSMGVTQGAMRQATVSSSRILDNCSF